MITWDFDGFESPADHSINWSVFYFSHNNGPFDVWEAVDEPTLFVLALEQGGP